MQPLILLGFAIAQPNLRLFIADFWGELNIALPTSIGGITAIAPSYAGLKLETQHLKRFQPTI
jgi:hypothetical protein